MKRMTFELPDDATLFAFTVVMNVSVSDQQAIATFTDCRGVEDGTIMTLANDGTDARRIMLYRKEMRMNDELDN